MEHCQHTAEAQSIAPPLCPASPGGIWHVQVTNQQSGLTTRSLRRLAESSRGLRGGSSLRACRDSQSRESNHLCLRTSSAPPGPMPSRLEGFLSSKRDTRSCTHTVMSVKQSVVD